MKRRLERAAIWTEGDKLKGHIESLDRNTVTYKKLFIQLTHWRIRC